MASAKRIHAAFVMAMRLDDIPYCDLHAEFIMTVYCGKSVQIERPYNPDRTKCD